MCARFSRFVSQSDILTLLGGSSAFLPDTRYNISPGADVLILTAASFARRHFEASNWGLTPSWAGTPSKRIANVRSESFFVKPAFRSLAIGNRCVFLASSYFEWRSESLQMDLFRTSEATGKHRRQPYCFCCPSEPVLLLAGIWQLSGLDSQCAVLTEDASPDTTQIHDRMPVVISASDLSVWLDSSVPHSDIEKLIAKSARLPRAFWKVSLRVNSIHNEGPDLVARIN